MWVVVLRALSQCQIINLGFEVCKEFEAICILKRQGTLKEIQQRSFTLYQKICFRGASTNRKLIRISVQSAKSTIYIALWILKRDPSGRLQLKSPNLLLYMYIYVYSHLYIQHTHTHTHIYIYIYISCWSRVKWSNPGKGVTPSSTPRCCNYWKRNLRVTLDYGRQIYLYIYIYIYIYSPICI